MYSKEETQQLRKEFWKTFSDYTKFYSRKIGEPITWMYYKTGIKGLELKFDIEKKAVRVALEVNARSDERRFNIFLELDNYRAILESGINEEIFWDDEFELPEGKIVSRMFIEWEGIKYHNRDNWPKIYKYMAENMYQFQSNFLDIHEIMKEKFGKQY